MLNVVQKRKRAHLSAPYRETMDEEKTIFRILIAEEHEGHYAALRKLLDAMQAPRTRAAQATTPEAALQALARDEHDVCLVAHEFGQPDGGVDLVQKAQTEGYLTPLLLLLDEANEGTIAAGTAAGAAGWLVREELSVPLLAQSLSYAVARAQTDAVRRQSETRYRLLFANMVDGMALHDVVYDDGAPVDYIIREVNPPFEASFGVSRLIVAGRPASTVYTELDGRLLDHFHRAETAGEPVHFEAHFPPTSRTFNISAFCPEPGRLAAIFRDDTERKVAEQQSRRQTARAQALARIAARLNAQLDLDGVLRAVCEETARALDAPAVAVVLYDEQRDLFHYAASHGLPSHFDRSARPVSRAVYEMLVGEQGPLIAIPDVQERDDLTNNELFAAVDVRTLVITTLARTDQLIGGLNVMSLGRSRVFSKGELALLQGIADQAAQAISNARLYNSTQRRLQRLQALNAIDRAILAHMRVEDALEVVIEQALTQLEADAASVWLLDQGTETLEQVVGRGFDDAAAGRRRLGLGEGAAGRAAQERRLIRIPDLTETSGGESWPAADTFVSYFAAPLIAGDDVQGVLEVYHREPFDPLPEWQVFLEALASQAAIAIDNARLFAETNRLLRQTRSQAQRVQQIVDTLPEGVLLLDADHQLVLANPVAKKFLPLLAQMTEENVVARLGDRALADLLQPDDDGVLWQEVTVSRPQRIFEVGGRPIHNDDHVGGWVLVVRDVTEERRRQQYVQTQERLATVGQLAAGIAHDFNNIMAIITLYSETLERNPDLPKRGQYLSTIKKQARHAATLISQILDFSRSAPVERSPLDLAPFVKEVVELLERTMPATIRLDVHVTDEACRVQGDPARLQQAIMNLAVNARDAMPGDGELTIRLDHAQVTPEQRPPVPEMAPGRWVRLAIADTGTGIPTADLPHIFEPFYTTKQRGEGTGLGLAQVYGIVKQHGGEIAVDSREGEGTSFTIYLPALEKGSPVDKKEGDRPPLPAAGGETILIAEDEVAMRMAVQDILLDLGYRVLVAGDGREAVALIEEHGAAIDLVISDIVMPEMGGEELYETLHRRWPQMKMILMSGYPLGESGHNFMEYAGAAWIQKPFSAGRLAQMLRAVLEAPAA